MTAKMVVKIAVSASGRERVRRSGKVRMCSEFGIV